ncbi:MAG TPA: papain-like cysteine protease family protein [Terriglobales bacterium]|nr:papain-like cysteine protease family protein [Terriglobales bacterium]
MNTTTPGKNDVFDGYVVEARYLVLAERAEEVTFREVVDRFVCQGTGNEFGFELPDIHQLALDKELRLAVRNRKGLEVFSKEFPLANVVRSEKPLDLPIDRIEAPPTRTAVTLHGRLVWKGDTQKTDGFEGFKVTADFKAQADDDDQTYVAQSAAATLGAGTNKFSTALPAEEELKKDEPIPVTVTYPDGHSTSGGSFNAERLREDVVLEVVPPQAIVVKTDARVEETKPERIKGKVVDLEGKHQIRNKQVILWGKRDGAARPILVAVTDGYGNFSGDRPKDELEAALGTVAGTLNATVEMGVPMELEGVAEEEHPTGKLPKFVYLVVKLPQRYTEDDDACGCDGTKVPRQPDPEDLVKNSGAYSQDIGLNCVNFTTPNRTLEEFSYTMVVRTTDPAIKGTTLSDIEKRTERERTVREMAAEASVSEILPTLSSRVLAKSIPATTRSAQPVLSSLNIAAAATKFALPTYWKDVFKTVPGRGELNASNSIDWDSTPTFYQAATIAHGHVLHFKQIWKADGYSLGDLVYSLPLAPGQKKQVVIFDWDRTEYGRRDEDTHEDEALNSYLSHNRDILDITRGSLAEHMTGGSRASTSGVSGGLGVGIGAMFSSVMVGVAGGFSASSGSASSSAWQDSSRDVAATGMNQLRDMVQQGASAVRNQRSTVVQTARQTERFRVETEVVANHNHCHAITLQYFEVLRHYAIEQKLTHVQECLFIPLLMSEFDEAKVVRWKDQLRPALRDPNPRNVFILSTGGISYRNKPLADGFDAIERRQNNYAGTDFPTTTYAAEEVLDLSGDLYISLTLNRPKDKDDANADYPLIDADWALYTMFTGWTTAFIFNNYFAKRAQQERDRIFEETIAPKIAEGFIDTLKFLAIDKDGNPHSIDLDTTLISRYQRDATLYVSVRPKQGKLGITREQISKLVIYTNYDISASANSRIIVRRGTFRYRTAHFDGVLYRNDAINNDLKSTSIAFPGGTITIPTDNVTLYTPLSTEELRNPRKEDEELSKKLRTHLNSNIEYYHKAIWYRMDPDRRYMLLDGFIAPNSNGKSVASVVENRVIGIAGNCLIMPVAPGYKLDPTYEYESELDDNGEPRRDERGNIIYKPTNLLDHYQPLTPIPPFRVSVPTRGVFGESIMGACNSCEKKDETRFWRWEESPNPDEPTPINPIQTAPPQRTEPQGLQPTAFPTPMINLQNAPQAPEPGATLAGALGLLGKSDLFPNITGLDQNQKNALQAMLSNQESAKHYADKAAELAKQAANLKSGDSTVESIKKSMDDGTLDKDTGKKLIEDVYRAQISGKPSSDAAASTANNSALSKAAAESVQAGREVKASVTHPDGTSTSVEQKSPAAATGGKVPDKVNFVLPENIPVMKQPSDMSCWATVATMMVNWKEQPATPYTIEEVLTRAGQEYLQKFKNGAGLARSEKLAFLSALGMAPDEGNFQSNNYDYYLEKLKAYGPLWVTVDVSDTELAAHAKIIRGIRGDGTPTGTSLLIIDPNGGKTYEETFQQFTKEYEDVVRETPAGADLFIQIVRFGDQRAVDEEGRSQPQQRRQLINAFIPNDDKTVVVNMIEYPFDPGNFRNYKNWKTDPKVQHNDIWNDKQLRQVDKINQIAIHETGSEGEGAFMKPYTAHLAVLRNGNIVQFNDLVEMEYHISAFNDHSIGIEFANLSWVPDAKATAATLQDKYKDEDKYLAVFWGEGRNVYTLPSVTQLDRLVELLTWLVSFNSPPDPFNPRPHFDQMWHQLVSYDDVSGVWDFPAASIPATAADKAKKRYFIMTFGHRYLTPDNFLDTSGIICHATVARNAAYFTACDHVDGALPSLYACLRMVKNKNSSAAYDLMKDLMKNKFLKVKTIQTVPIRATNSQCAEIIENNAPKIVNNIKRDVVLVDLDGI